MSDKLQLGRYVSFVAGGVPIEGTVIYRDLDLVRIATNGTAVEFPMNGRDFIDEVGPVTHPRGEDPLPEHYTAILGVKDGDTLEFFALNGDSAGTGKVLHVITSETPWSINKELGLDLEEDILLYDAVILEDGRIIDFSFRGPPDPPIVRIVPEAEEAPEEAPEEAAPGAVPEPAEAEEDLRKLMAYMSQYTAVIKEKPVINRTYDDAVQRKEMFDELMDYELDRKIKQKKGNRDELLAAEKQKNDRRLFRRVDREVELALALKNKSLDNGVFTEPVETFQAAVDDMPAAIPIVVAARVLNIDVIDAEYKESDIEPRILADVENAAVAKHAGYLDETEGYTEFNYYGYMYDMFSNEQVLAGDEADGWKKDQEVIRTADLGIPTEGLSAKPELPGIDKTGKVVEYPLSAGINRNVRSRIIRALTSDVKGSNLLAPSDPSIVSGHVILPPEAALLRSPRMELSLSYVVDEEVEPTPSMDEILKSHGPKSRTTPWSLTDQSLTDWLGETIDFVHSADALAPRTPHLLRFLDLFGLGDTMPVSIAEVIHAKVLDSQTIWSSLYAGLRVAPLEPRTFAGGLLWTHLRGSAVLADVLRDIEKRNPTIYDAPIVLASSLMTTVQGDAMPLVWEEIAALDGRGAAPQATTDAIELSRKYTLRRLAARDKMLVDLAALAASPEINTCEHVQILEGIRNMADVVESDVNLLNFITVYKEREDENWVYCKICHKECVCKHDVLRLKVLAQPWNAEGIHKQVMKTFGGERYLGKIVCRVCGQPLDDIEYDDNVEFDDNGKAVLTSSVLTAEQLAPLEFADIWGKSDPAKMTAKERTVYARTQRLTAAAAAAAAAEAVYLERLTPTQRSIYDVYRSVTAGVTLPLPLISNIVQLTEKFINAYVALAGKLEALQAAKKSTYDATIAKFAGKKYDSLPPRRESANAAAVGAITALLAIAAQQGVPITPGTHNLKGYPGEQGGEPGKSGVLRYLSNVVATQTQQDSERLLLDYVIPAAFSFSGNSKATIKLDEGLVASVPALLTPEAMPAAVEAPEMEAEAVVAVAKHVEVVAATFRPDMAPLIVDALPAETVRQLADSTAVTALADALRIQAMSHIGGLHRNVAGVATIAKQSTEGVCCAADMDSWMTQPPSRLLTAYTRLLSDVPFLTGSGTLFETVVAPPAVHIAEGSIDEDVKAKLFRAYCHVEGPAYGNAHEFSYGNRCRRCGYTDEPVDDMDVRFPLLSAAVRANRQLRKQSAGQRITWKEQLAQLAPSAAFAKALEACLVQPNVTGSEKELKRKIIGVWKTITEHRDALMKRLGADSEIFKILVKLTTDPFVEGPRLIQEYLCATVNVVATKSAIVSIKGASWAGIARPIDETMTQVLQQNAVVASDEAVAMRKLVVALSPAINTWIKVVRPSSDPEWSAEWAQKLLLTLVLDAWATSGVSTEFMRSLLQHARTQTKKYSDEEVKRMLQQRAAAERALILSEFDSIKDDDQRAVTRTLKNLGIGRWAIGKNIRNLDEGVLLFEEEQRRKMGIIPGESGEPGLEALEEPGLEDAEAYDVTQADGEDE